MMNVLALYQLKGGVGKTSTAVNLASLAATSGLQVLLWDLDPQGAATWLSGVDATLDAKSKHWLKGKSALGRCRPPARIDCSMCCSTRWISLNRLWPSF